MLLALYLGRGYAFELDVFRTVHSWSEWSVCADLNCVLTRKHDHCPKISFILILGRWKLFEVSVYNVNHADHSGCAGDADYGLGDLRDLDEGDR